jgi:hypothetical protein
LPLVYQELRKLAAQKLAQKKPGQTLQATALVHEAYLRHLERHDAGAARLVKLRYLAGPSHQHAAVALGIGRGAADRVSLARACLFCSELHNPFRADVFGSIGASAHPADTRELRSKEEAA